MVQDIKIFRKESLISVLSGKGKSAPTTETNIWNVPKDNFYLCYIFFFFVGCMSIIPPVFIGTAANYWMYKFRNTTLGEHPLQRTSLQSLYQSSSLIANTVPQIVFSVFAITVGKKYDARTVNIFSLTAIFFVFFIFSAFTRINTDSWQLDFFIISMILQGINSSAVATYQVHSMTILAKFPTKYTKLFLLGQNGGILTDILQIISISVTDSDSDAALIFFITGTIIVAGNICLSFGMKYTKIYAYYLSENSLDEVSEKDGSTSSSWAEVRHVAKLIWPIIAMLGIYMFTSSCVHPSVTTLVQSKHVLDGKAWERKYFTAVIVFLLADVSCLLGTSIFIGKIKKSNYPFWLVGMMIRMVISVGFVTLCNAQPRKNLPIVFHEDWQFVLFIIVYNVTLGYSWNVCFLSVRGLSEGKQELALKLITSAVTIAGAVFSVNGVIVVKLL